MDSYKSFFESFFKALEDSKISYAILRGFEQLPEYYSNDVDFGVLRKDFGTFISILKEQGEIFDGTLILYKVRLDVYKFRMKLPAHNIDIDIWTSFNYAGLPYLDHQQVLSSPRYYNGFKVLKPENEVALSFLKECLHMNRLRKDKVAIIKSKINDKFHVPFHDYFSGELSALFKKAIENEVFNLKTLSLKARMNLLKNNIIRNGLFATLRAMLTFLKVRLNGKNIIKNFVENI